MTPEQLSQAIVDALRSLADDGSIELPDGPPAQVHVERPKSKAHGDYATNVAMRLGKQTGVPPREIAELLAVRLRDLEGLSSAEVAGPGFINVTIAPAAQGQLARDIVAAGRAYGTSTVMAAERVNVEFVSANPTGPLTLAHTRWAAVGDSVSRILSAVGADVTREYYFNDHGTQIDRFARSLLARARGREVPEDGYRGAYVEDIASLVLDRRPEVADLPDDEAQAVLRTEGVEQMFDEIKAALREFGVVFDVYFHEYSLHEEGAVDHALARIVELGQTYEKDGALWLRTSDYGDDKDRVLVKSDGQPAYIAADLAYYLNKRERGFDRCMIVLGADHHGYVGRLMAMCAAFGDKPGENLETLIGQMVNLLQDGQPVRMGKRAGNIITLEDLVDAIGADAGRYALVRYSIDSNIDIDLALWTRRTSDNPVYYVQYAHARLASILRNAVELGLAPAGDEFDPGLLSHEREGDLLRALAEFPRVVHFAATLREPHRVPRYLESLASTFHKFYDECRVLPRGDEEPGDLHRARLLLVEATQTVVANGLDLVGVSAPDRM